MLVPFLAAAGQALRHPCVHAERTFRRVPREKLWPSFLSKLRLRKRLIHFDRRVSKRKRFAPEKEEHVDPCTEVGISYAQPRRPPQRLSLPRAIAPIPAL
uniref:Uncharacterized protein n=1 Tax=Ixodes ricinus TaxID=34613 RepID=A0A6B0UGQ1_IXORI